MADGGVGQCGDPITVLDDLASGWKGHCAGLTRAQPNRSAGENCQLHCEKNVKCAGWQEAAADDPSSSCWEGVGSDCYSEDQDKPKITSAQRLMRGHYRELKNLKGYVVTDLKFAFGEDHFGADLQAASMACNHTCLSLLTCEVWQYSVQSGCYYHDPSYKALAYPPTTATMSKAAPGASSVVAGAYIQRYCRSPIYQASSDTVALNPAVSMYAPGSLPTLAPLGTTTTPPPTPPPLVGVATLPPMTPPPAAPVVTAAASPGSAASGSSKIATPAEQVREAAPGTIAPGPTPAPTEAPTIPPPPPTTATATTAAPTTATATTTTATTTIPVGLPPPLLQDRFILDVSGATYFEDFESRTVHLVRSGCEECEVPGATPSADCKGPVRVPDTYVAAGVLGEDFECDMLSGGQVQVENDLQPTTTAAADLALEANLTFNVVVENVDFGFW